MKAPFPYFGGKATIAKEVWDALGSPQRYIEPFFGSGAVLLNRPNWENVKSEIINDKDGNIANVWRAIKFSPDVTAEWCDWPVNHCVPSGTMISTPNGNVPVEKIKVGMVVLGYNGDKIVKTVVENTTKRDTTEKLVAIKQLQVTKNHPIWTSSGYVPAGKIIPGMVIGLLTNQTLLHYTIEHEAKTPETETETKTVGNLYTYRPQNWKNSIRRFYKQRSKKSVQRPSCWWKKRKKICRTVDWFFTTKRSLAGFNYYRNWRRNQLAGKRTKLDFKTKENLQIDEFNRWGRRNDRNETHTRSNRKNTRSKHWKTTYPGKYCKNGESEVGTQTERRTQSKNIESTQRKNANKRTQSKNSSKNNYQKTSLLYRNRTIFFINNRYGEVLSSKRSKYIQCIKTKHTVQRTTFSTPLITVYNFQTKTGNYFANSILVHNCDQEARRQLLIRSKQVLLDGLLSDPKWCDPVLAGYWIYVAGCWIGSGMLQESQRPQITHPQGIASQRPHVAQKTGVRSKRPHVAQKTGIRSKIPTLDHQRGIQTTTHIERWFKELSNRLRQVDVVCGDWQRVCGGNWQDTGGAGKRNMVVGYFFDPPYSEVATRKSDLYQEDSESVAHDVREWCLERGERPTYRIVLAGYYEEHLELLKYEWTVHQYKVQGGFGNQGKAQGGKNRFREALFLSPHCLRGRKTTPIF